MKRIALIILLLNGCSNLSSYEHQQYRNLELQGITIDKPGTDKWSKPANAGAAGALNLLPGIGNFYLASGNGGDSNHFLYGTLNLLTWPFSILWGIPGAAIDANSINKRELIYYYQYVNNKE